MSMTKQMDIVVIVERSFPSRIMQNMGEKALGTQTTAGQEQKGVQIIYAILFQPALIAIWTKVTETAPPTRGILNMLHGEDSQHTLQDCQKDFWDLPEEKDSSRFQLSEYKNETFFRFFDGTFALNETFLPPFVLNDTFFFTLVLAQNFARRMICIFIFCI